MVAVVSALIPVFVLILAGYAIRKVGFLPDSFWPPAEKLTYWVTFPALLLVTLATARFDGLPVWQLAGLEATATLATFGAMLALGRRIATGGPAYSSLIQGAIRPNTYFGLAAAAALYQGPGVALMAICVAAVVPLVNLLSVVTLVRWAAPVFPGWLRLGTTVLRNPLIIACLLGVLLNGIGYGLPTAVAETLRILGSAALPIGVLAVGAGLDFGALARSGRAVMLASGLKLVLLPAVTGLGALVLGFEPMTIGVAVLYAGLPCSATAYVMARQLGGDGPLIANIISAETVFAALTMPLLLILFAMP